jgi:hypothetical protein
MKKTGFYAAVIAAVMVIGGIIFYACQKENTNTQPFNNEEIIKSKKNFGEEMRFRVDEKRSIIMKVSYPDPAIDTTTVFIDYEIVSVNENDNYAFVLLGYFHPEEVSDSITPDGPRYAIHPWDFKSVRIATGNTSTHTGGIIPDGNGGTLTFKSDCQEYVCDDCFLKDFHIGNHTVDGEIVNAYYQCYSYNGCSPCSSTKMYVYISNRDDDKVSTFTVENSSVFVVKADHIILNGVERDLIEMLK